MNQAEKNDILDQHKQVYDGYVTTYGQQINQQPLYVQDFANDKVGLVVNNKGVVKPYSNMRINEMRFDGKSTGLFSEEEDTYMTPTDESFNHLDMIGDGEDDLEYGTMGDSSDWDIELDDYKDRSMYDPYYGDSSDWDMEIDEEEYSEDDEAYLNDVDEDMIEPLQEQVNKTLDMFNRFKRY
jgi:hypothetical protein